jgi:hypothetical protein
LFSSKPEFNIDKEKIAVGFRDGFKEGSKLVGY